MAESASVENVDTDKKSNKARYFRAKVLQVHTAKEINQIVLENIDDKTIVFSDQSTSSLGTADCLEMHITKNSSNEFTEETLKWEHIFISNAKRNLLGDYHKIKDKYLDEFVYKLNSRYFRDKLPVSVLIASITGE